MDQKQQQQQKQAAQTWATFAMGDFLESTHNGLAMLIWCGDDNSIRFSSSITDQFGNLDKQTTLSLLAQLMIQIEHEEFDTTRTEVLSAFGPS